MWKLSTVINRIEAVVVRFGVTSIFATIVFLRYSVIVVIRLYAGHVTGRRFRPYWGQFNAGFKLNLPRTIDLVA